MKSLDNQYQLEERINRFLEEKHKKYPELNQEVNYSHNGRFLRTW